VAYIACGGRHIWGEEAGFAPGGKLMNIKVINDVGEATDETVILGMEEALRLRVEAEEKYRRTDPLYPNSVNISFGRPDTGDPEDPVRIATERLATHTAAYSIFCAAGNLGPEPGTVTLPGTVKDTWTVGTLKFTPFDLWQKSGRGPAPFDVIKPDLVCYGYRILCASHRADDAFDVVTGTSISSPMLAGGWGIVFEWGNRFLPEEVLNMLDKQPREYWEGLWAGHAVKGPAAPSPPGVKDNWWGLGMPMGDLIARTLTQPAPTLEPLIGGMFGIAMLGMIVARVLEQVK